MERLFYISNDLDDLEGAQRDFLENGFSESQLHVLSDDEAGLQSHHLHTVNVFNKTDVVHSTVRGAIIGIVASVLAMSVSSSVGLVNDIGWIPIIFLGIIVLGLSTWEGGMWGIQKFNSEFSRFENLVHSGKHIMIVDYEPNQTNTIAHIINHHPSMLSP